MVCVNKADLNRDGAVYNSDYCDEHDIDFAGEIPLDRTVVDAMVQGKPVASYQPSCPASTAIKAVWDHAMDVLCNQNEH